ncbi:MAG: hypothetical protein QOG20_4540 [Pseudonocardiales bacterium]|nr:hypothetical protein [Pseudonocardiales bacterium]
MARRLHDRDHTGWWVLILLTPVTGFLVMLVFTLSEGTRGPNRHGADRRRRSPADDRIGVGIDTDVKVRRERALGELASIDTLP